MKSIPHILFVCMGNICRSPSAEIIWTKKLSDITNESNFHCESAGTINYHTGSPPDSRMLQALKKAGYPGFGQARAITEEDFDRFDLILAMDQSNLQKIQKLARNNPSASEKIHLFCEYTGIKDVKEVPDPYYGGSEGFIVVIRLLEQGCENLISKLGINNFS